MIISARGLRIFLIICAGAFFSIPTLKAQDTLPGFSVKKRPNSNVIVSWKNLFPDIRQLTIQRSPTGKSPFKSIITLPDPNLPENGFMDPSSAHDSMYYRLYILLDSGRYIFSEVKRAMIDTSRQVEKNNTVSAQLNERPSTGLQPVLTNTIPKNIPQIIVKIRDSIAGAIPETSLKKFRDSVLYKTKDTLFFLTKDTLEIKPFVPKEVYRPSIYVFTTKDGNVMLSLPPKGFPYKVVFYEMEGTKPLFELDKIRTPVLTLDKANFIRSGWFRFELYEEGNHLMEKHKLYIPRDF